MRGVRHGAFRGRGILGDPTGGAGRGQGTGRRRAGAGTRSGTGERGAGPLRPCMPHVHRL
ncbi:hypothetical protein C5C05_06910 [Clavibacter michiganensis]|nr:hypothetical protein C5C05_06910 [Clavibacter michiganensis]